jgi:ATP-dependent helicase/nuclease subunit B
MTPRTPRVYNIAPGGNFLEVLAHQIFSGFPFLDGERKKYPLHHWTILLPTRRASRKLGSVLAETSDKNALLLPKIQPIGDVDLDGEVASNSHDVITNAISRTGQLLMLLDLLKDWAAQNPQIPIATEIAASSVKSIALTTSLLELVDQMDVEETNLNNLAEAYQSDLSEHRNSILSLLGLLKVELPRKLNEEKLITPSARRSLLIRLQAQSIATKNFQGPVIAAGSTGTIPATRQLLKAIAHHSQGAVVLPGLDHHMSDEDWLAIGPDHPQFTLRSLISTLEIERRDIANLNGIGTSRNRLSSEIMRPSASTELWHSILPKMTSNIVTALDGLCLMGARDRHVEARSIALILRQALETPHQTAALVTPDRDLAQRVKSELLRWNIKVDDSAGVPLIDHGLASLAGLVLRAILNDLSSEHILATLSHPDCTLGLTREGLLCQLRHFEIVVLRGYSSGSGPKGWNRALARALEAKQTKARVHSIVSAMNDEDWISLSNFVARLDAVFSGFPFHKPQENSQFISEFRNLVMQLAPDVDWSKAENQEFDATLQQLRQESFRLKSSSPRELMDIILNVLQEKNIPSRPGAASRLSIYGVLEARLLPADILILGGLNEGIWPAQPDTGPWLNRSMRTTFEMQQPERDIGVSAHDFVQALGYRTVYITWSQRMEGSPQNPSRWVIRLKTILAGAGIGDKLDEGKFWLDLAQSIDATRIVSPSIKPKPCPPISARPLQFSVTEVEKLIRDPYAIYARKILKLEPLDVMSREPDAALRGTLFHNALKIWNQQQPEKMSDACIDLLMAAGKQVFSSLSDDPDVMSFWWPRFQRMAAWLAGVESHFRQDARHVFSEIEGYLTFLIEGKPHKLTARADRIDILESSHARIIDYKSGKPPTAREVISGISPQLTLEAAMLAAGAFKSIGAAGVDEMMYVHISGSKLRGDIISIESVSEFTPDELARKHFAGFQRLLSKYQRADQVYLPRAALQKEEEASDYDHLSRHKEWMLAGDR